MGVWGNTPVGVTTSKSNFKIHQAKTIYFGVAVFDQLPVELQTSDAYISTRRLDESYIEAIKRYGEYLTTTQLLSLYNPLFKRINDNFTVSGLLENNSIE